MIEKGIIPREKFSRAAMVAHLASHPERRQELLNHNPRYVFFRLDEGASAPHAFGSLQVPLTPYRSVAVDPAVFPPGGLAWMETQGRPSVARFVLCQDEGGAIKGPARVDYFAGAGPEAESFAVGFWQTGSLYFFVKKRNSSNGKP